MERADWGGLAENFNCVSINSATEQHSHLRARRSLPFDKSVKFRRPRFSIASGQNAIYLRVAFKFANRLNRIRQFFKRAVECGFQVRSAIQDSRYQVVVNRVAAPRHFQKSQHETVNRQSGEGARSIAQPLDLSIISHDERLGFAQHHSRRNFDRRSNIANQLERRSQSSDLLMADDLQTAGPAAFGGYGLLDRADDDFENWLPLLFPLGLHSFLFQTIQHAFQ